MTNTKRWLDELPLGSSERDLIRAGRGAQPPRGMVDAEWQALCLVLGATVAVPSAAASSSAAAPASAKAASSLLLGKATAVGTVSAAVKSLALGFGLGLGVVGASSVVQHFSRSTVQSANVARPSPPPSARRAVVQPARPAVPAPDVPTVATAPAVGATAAFPTQTEPRVSNEPNHAAAAVAATPTSSPTSSPSSAASSLSAQARELAELKRLIDVGQAAEALRRFDQHVGGDALSSLSEERDALYVQALNQAQRPAEARLLAQRFLTRYPHSPYLGMMRQLAEQ